jgi:hypothetical protein
VGLSGLANLLQSKGTSEASVAFHRCDILAPDEGPYIEVAKWNVLIAAELFRAMLDIASIAGR